MEALDLFAGTGWGIACQRLGIQEHGVELMPEAVATRAANGMTTAYRDVWDGVWNYGVVPKHDLLIASPPCQTFSVAGSGAGRRALDDVLRLIDEEAYDRPLDLRAFADEHGDDRTALVLTPLVYAWSFMPTYVVLEQVPTVLPVWEAYAARMREWGYSVAVSVLHAEQYGVPQTRKRAILIARKDGIEAAMPTPTHSRYYSRDAARLDLGVLPWVSMADALGWGMTERPYLSIAVGTEAGGTDPAAIGGSGARRTLHGEKDSGRWIHERPSTTIVGSFRPDIVAAPGWRKPGDGPRQNAAGSVKVTAEQAAVLQSYPPGFEFSGGKGKVFQQIGNAVPPLLAEAVLRTLVEPPLP